MPNSKTIPIFLSGVAVLLLLFVASCAGLFIFGQRSNDIASPKIDALFAAMLTEQFDESYDSITSAEFRRNTSRRQFNVLADTIVQNLGPLRSKTLRSFRQQTVNSQVYVEVAYDAQFEKAQGMIIAKLVEEGDDWKFASFFVDSPVFHEEEEPASKQCPQCRESIPSDAHFCPKCKADLHAPAIPGAAPTQPPSQPPSNGQPQPDQAAEPKTP